MKKTSNLQVLTIFDIAHQGVSLLLILIFSAFGCAPPDEQINEILVVSNIADFHQSPADLRLETGNELFYIHHRALYADGKMVRWYAVEGGSLREKPVAGFSADTALQRATGLPFIHNWKIVRQQFLVRDTVQSPVEYLENGYYLCSNPHFVFRTNRIDD
jgi:hypothetical protein